MVTWNNEGSCDVEEATVERLQQQMRSGETSCSALVDAYLERIERWDGAGPGLASILALNPAARDLAAKFDAMPREQDLGPLHGVPVVVKDNCNTMDMPTTGGCLALRGSIPTVESAVVRKLAGAGAIVLAKTNLHDLALSGTTVSSLGGQTRNPYDLERTPGGSSGGSGVAVAMNFAMAAIGTDTVNSIRSPASANCIVGLRPTRGLVSRAGIIPVSSTQDAVGPMARTVADVARVLDVLVGYDPDDPVTARCIGKIPKTYTRYLNRAGLKGKRIGYVPSLQGAEPHHREVNAAVDVAMDAMREAGAEVLSVDEFRIDADELIRDYDVQKWEFKYLFEAYLKGLPAAPISSVGELLESGDYHRATLQDFLTQANRVVDPDHDVEYLSRLMAIDRLRDRLLNMMAAYRVDVLAYPLQKRLVVPIGSPAQADRNGILAALVGFPALTVPMGFSLPTDTAPMGVPMGLDLLARPFDESVLIESGYAFEQITKVRRAPFSGGWCSQV